MLGTWLNIMSNIGQWKYYRHLAKKQEDFQNRPKIIELESTIGSYGESFYGNLIRHLKICPKYVHP